MIIKDLIFVNVIVVDALSSNFLLFYQKWFCFANFKTIGQLASGGQKIFDVIQINLNLTAVAIVVIIAFSRGLTQNHASGSASPVSKGAAKTSLAEAER